MRYQEPIYIQTDINAIRNKDIYNVNMSSEMCIFERPLFNISGASKIDCSRGETSGTSYVISSASTIPISFDFTGNTDTFTALTISFKYEIYKYSNNGDLFLIPAVYKSPNIEYSGFTSFSSVTQNIPIGSLMLDGEYLIKGYYNFDVCTPFLNKLGKRVDTLAFVNGTKYGLYSPELDYYFIAIKSADKPIFINNGENNLSVGSLYQQVILPESFTEINEDGDEVISTNVTTFTISADYAGDFVVTLNGLALANELDYTFSGNVITLNEPMMPDDIITVIFTVIGNVNLKSETINLISELISGATNNEGFSSNYYNTTTGKYEIYTNVTPLSGNDILVMINGVTLAKNVDYYQSSSNLKRIILEGNLMVGDVILIVYFPTITFMQGIYDSNSVISWMINNPPQMVNGKFTLEVSTGITFNTLYYTAGTDYIIGTTGYMADLVLSGSAGTNLYYRVKNEKNYVTICGDIINSTVYSEAVPITILSNYVNTY